MAEARFLAVSGVPHASSAAAAGARLYANSVIVAVAKASDATPMKAVSVLL